MKNCIQCDNPMTEGDWRNTDCCCFLCYIAWSRAEIERLKQKCFDDVMTAKRSGYEEGRTAQLYSMATAGVNCGSAYGCSLAREILKGKQNCKAVEAAKGGDANATP